MPVLLLLGSGINQARIRRRIFRLKILDRFKVGRVGHDFGKLLQLLELIQLCLFLIRDSSAHKNPPFGLDPKRTPRLKHRQLKTYAVVSHAAIFAPSCLRPTSHVPLMPRGSPARRGELRLLASGQILGPDSHKWLSRPIERRPDSYETSRPVPLRGSNSLWSSPI